MSKLRGKQHWQRVGADLRRTVAEVKDREAAEAEQRMAPVRAAKAERDALPPVDPAGARIVQDRKDGQWYEVVGVNAKTVTVAAFGLELKIPHHRIIGARGESA